MDVHVSLFRQASRGNLSAVEEAARLAFELSLICPKCGEYNNDPKAKPTIEYRDGEANCANCGQTWRPRREA